MSTGVRGKALSAAVAAAGAALFVYAVRKAGTQEILAGIRQMGWGLALVIALGGCRFLLRTECWRLCVPDGTSLSFGAALTAFLAGDAVGSVTPLGLLASEPTKVLLTRHHLATRESVASLALENLVYSVSVVVMIVVGSVLLLVTTPLPPLVTRIVMAGLVALVMIVGLAIVFLRRGQARFDRRLSVRMSALQGVYQQIAGFAANHPWRLPRIFALDLAYHALAVLEVFVTLEWLMGASSPTLVMAIVFETLNRVETVLFKMVPFRVGVDEALTGALAPLIAVTPVAGVALAVVRKVRSLFWAAVGLLAVALHPATARRAR